MTAHDYLVLAIAAFWMVVGALGLGFTIRRLRHPIIQQRSAVVGYDAPSPARWRGFPDIEGAVFAALARLRIGFLARITAVVAIAALVVALALSLSRFNSGSEGNHSSAQQIPQVLDKPPSSARAPVPSIVAKGGPYDAAVVDYEKVVPKNPNLVLGLPLYAQENHDARYMGRVTQINEAPRRKANSGITEKSLFITVEDDSGAAQTFEYGRVEWRAASGKDSPKLGIVLASASP